MTVLRNGLALAALFTLGPGLTSAQEVRYFKDEQGYQPVSGSGRFMEVTTPVNDTVRLVEF